MFEVELDEGFLLPGAVARKDGRLMLKCLPEGCPHLADRPENRCQVYEQRPSACRHFPFRVTDTPGGRYVGASFACSAILQKAGPRLERSDRDWDSLPLHGYKEMFWIEGELCSWERYLQVEEYLGDQLCFSHGCFSGALAVSLASKQNQWAQLGNLPLNWISEEIEAASQRTLRGLLVICEAGNEVDRAQEVLISQAQGGRYPSQIFQGWVEPKRIQACMEQEDSDEYWADVEPFFRHLLFRKFLWGAPSVHARICMLPLLNEIIRYWSWQQALVANSRPTTAMRHEAIREVERRLTFHAQGWEEFVLPLSLAFLQGVG